MKALLLVGVGGFFGSALRYLVSQGVTRAFSEPWLPYGTLAVNIAGCFAIGLLAGLADSRQLFSPELRLVLMVGLLGGFTTYSAFAYESLALLRNGSILAIATYVSVHLVIGILAVWIGHRLTA